MKGNIIVGFFISLSVLLNSAIPISTQFSKIDPKNEMRREFVKEMARDAWNAYEKSAWGADALKPVSKEKSDSKLTGLSIVASLTTLWVMDMKSEFEKAKKWIGKDLELENFYSEIYTGNFLTKYVGSFMSCYALTGQEQFWMTKANEYIYALEPNFNTTTGLPYQYISIDESEYPNQYLSQVAIQQPELIYFSNMTNNHLSLNERLIKIKRFMKKIDKPAGLYMSRIDVENGEWNNAQANLNEDSRDFYSNLLKSFIISNGQDYDSMQMFLDGMDAVESRELITKQKTSGLYYDREYDHETNQYTDRMYRTSCNLGAMFALAAHALKQYNWAPQQNKSNPNDVNRIARYKKLAQELTETCHIALRQTQTKLLPEIFNFDDKNYASSPNTQIVNLNPELAESYFMLWRTTRDPKYRDYAWQMAKAIKQHCRTESGGYAFLQDANQIPTKKGDLQEPQFLSGTLKYLYLTFSEDTVLPMDEWIFNAEGHPLPICAKNKKAFPGERCNKWSESPWKAPVPINKPATRLIVNYFGR